MEDDFCRITPWFGCEKATPDGAHANRYDEQGRYMEARNDPLSTFPLWIRERVAVVNLLDKRESVPGVGSRSTVGFPRTYPGYNLYLSPEEVEQWVAQYGYGPPAYKPDTHL